MSAQSQTYSFKDLQGAFVHPLLASFVLAGGSIGMGKITINMATERTEHNTSADGTVMPSYIAGDGGSLDIECQQTSAFHKFMLLWYNTCKTLADSGDVSSWASATIAMRAVTDGSVHTATGVSPTKIPEKTYAAQGGMITWRLMAANIVNL